MTDINIKNKKILLQDLFDLLRNSPAIKSMRPYKIKGLIDYISESESHAEEIYNILVEEKTLVERVEKNFVKIVNGIMEDLDNAITEAKIEFGRNKFKNARDGRTQNDQAVAESLLTNLK